MSAWQALKRRPNVAALVTALGCCLTPLGAQTPDRTSSLPAGAVAKLGDGRFWHGTAIRTLAFSPDETVIASLGADQRICIWDAASGRLRKSWTCERTEVDVNDRGFPPASGLALAPALVFSGDGSVLAMADPASRRCRRWEVATGKELPSVPLSSADADPPPIAKAVGKRTLVVGTFALSHNGRQLAVDQGKVHEIFIVDTDQKQTLRKLDGRHGARVTALTFSPSGKLLASGGEDQTIRIWDTRQGKMIATLNGHRAAIQELAFAPDGKRLMSASSDGTLRIWDIASGRTPASAVWKPAALQDADGEVQLATARTVTTQMHRVWFESDGRRCGAHYSITFGTTGIVENTVIWFDATNGKVLDRQMLHEHRLAGATTTAAALLASRVAAARAGPTAVAPGRKLVARTSASNHVQIVALDTGLPVSAGLHAGCADVEMAGDHVAIVQHGDPAIHLWNWKTKQMFHKLEGHTGQPFLVGFGPRGKTLVSASRSGMDRSLSVWDVASAAEARLIAGWHPGGPAPNTSAFAVRATAAVSVPQPRLSPDGKLLAFRGSDGNLRVVDLHSGADVAAYPFSWQGDGCLAFTSDSRHLVLSQAYDQRNVTANGGKGKLKREARCYLQIIDVATAKEVAGFAKLSHDFHIQRLALAGRQALVGCTDGSIRNIDLASGKAVRDVWTPPVAKQPPAKGKQPGFTTATVQRTPFFVASRDGGMFALRGLDGSGISIVETATGKERHLLPVAPTSVTSMGFAPDGRHLVTGSNDGSVIVWTLGAEGALADTKGEAAWQTLAGDDARAAFAAMRQFLDAPTATAILASRVQPAAAPDAAVVAKYLQNLDSPSFTTRQKAQNELIKLGEVVRGPVQQAAAAPNASAEIVQRAQMILQRIDSGAPTGDALRQLRAVELLERIGTKEARAILERVASGAPDALLTFQARAAVDRMNR